MIAKTYILYEFVIIFQTLISPSINEYLTFLPQNDLKIIYW